MTDNQPGHPKDGDDDWRAVEYLGRHRGGVVAGGCSRMRFFHLVWSRVRSESFKRGKSGGHFSKSSCPVLPLPLDMVLPCHHLRRNADHRYPIGGARTVLRMGVSLHSERSRARKPSCRYCGYRKRGQTKRGKPQLAYSPVDWGWRRDERNKPQSE
jgi:hypothetical protein